MLLIENKNNNEQKKDDEYDDEEAENVRLKTTQTPMFLNAFLENQQKIEKKEKPPTVFLQLFNTEIINDIKYYLFTVKLDEKKDKNKKENEKKDLKDSTPLENSNITSKELISSQIKKTELTNSKITNNKEDEGSENHPLKDEVLDEEEDDDEKEEILRPPERKEDNNDDKDKNNEDTKNKDYQNYVDYYNTFYDSQHSMSMTMNAANYASVSSSMGVSMSSDIFGFLLITYHIHK